MSDAQPYRYEELASFIVGLIDSGTLPAGARAPSLRRISAQRRTSLTTALQAYRLLEDRGILEARPQSGFYVARGRAALEAPGVTAPPERAGSVAVSSLVQQLLEHTGDVRLAPLGCAIPSAELLAAGRLDRFLARAARTRGAEYNTYTPPKGDPRLREEIARRALRWGQALSPEEIVVTCGCTEALAHALRAVTRPGDTVAIESPTYFGLLLVIEALELKALELPTDAGEGIETAALEAALRGGEVQACVFSSSFNNPLGCTMPEAKKLAVLDLLAEHGVPLVEDDIYGDIFFGEARPRPFMALDRHGNTLLCSSFSKTVAPGYRIGWVAAGRRLAAVLRGKHALTLCGPALPQAALADFLASGGYDSHLRRIRRVFAENIDRMTHAIGRDFPAGTRVSRPAGGFVLWLELPQPFDARKLFEPALQRGVCFAPGDVFAPSARYTSCLRLSCGHPWDERIERAVRTLGEMACEMVGQ